MDVAPNSPVARLAPALDAQAMVSQRRAARRRRTRRLRRLVAGAAVSTFAALWTVIYVQLASGHDPALPVSSAPATTTASAASTNLPVTTTASAPSSSRAATTTSTSVPGPVTTTAASRPAPVVPPAAAVAAPAPAAVTTRQS